MLLGQQYYDNPKFAEVLSKNFILFRALRGDLKGEALYRKYGVSGTPFILFLDGDGREVDWIRGYSAPPDKFHEKILKVFRGEDTVKSLSASYASLPMDVQVLTKLGAKYFDRGEYEKSVSLYREVLAVDPDGAKGSTESGKNRVSCTEFADFQLARAACWGQGFPKRESGPLEHFLEKYPDSKLKKEAYNALSIFFSSGRADKKAVEAFFEKAFALYPDDPWIRYYYAQEAIYSKENLDRAIEAAEEIQTFGSATAAELKANLYAQKGDLARAEAVYGKEFAEGLASSLASAYQTYAEFWIEKKKNLESAEKMLLTSIQLSPSSASARQALADFYLAAGKTDKALDFFGPAFVKMPGAEAYPLTVYTRFWIQKKQNMESALEALELSVKLTAETAGAMNSSAIQNAAQMFYQLGKPERALEIFGPSYIRGRMYDPIALSGYARFWASKKTNLESALSASEAAVKLREPISLNKGSYWSTLSSVYQALGRLEDALMAAEKALENGGGFNEDYFKTQIKKIQEEIAKKKAA